MAQRGDFLRSIDPVIAAIRKLSGKALTRAATGAAQRGFQQQLGAARQEVRGGSGSLLGFNQRAGLGLAQGLQQAQAAGQQFSLQQQGTLANVINQSAQTAGNLSGGFLDDFLSPLLGKAAGVATNFGLASAFGFGGGGDAAFAAGGGGFGSPRRTVGALGGFQ